MFAIEKNIPLPEVNNKEGTSIYPFSKLKVGDSFFIPATVRRGSSVTRSKRKVLANYCNRAKAKTGFNFALRTMKGGFRIWRVK